jgi:uncharacterized membrane protein YhaH (DUF805 family)
MRLRLRRLPYLAILTASYGLGVLITGPVSERLARSAATGLPAETPIATRLAMLALIAAEVLAVAGRLRDIGRSAWWALVWLAVPLSARLLPSGSGVGTVAAGLLPAIWLAALITLGLLPGRR